MTGAKTSGKTGKDSQPVTRIKKTDRDRFVQLCKDLDTGATREITRLVRIFPARTGDTG